MSLIISQEPDTKLIVHAHEISKESSSKLCIHFSSGDPGVLLATLTHMYKYGKTIYIAMGNIKKT